MQNEALLLLELFKQASTTSISQLSQSVKRDFYKKNTMILDHYTATHTFLYITKGWVKLFKESADGEEIIIDVLTQDNYCGEDFLFDTDKTNTYSVQSITDIEVLTLPLLPLKTLILTDHGLSLGFLQMSLKKRQYLHMEVEHLTIQNAAQRIGCFILRLCDLASKDTNIILRLPYDKVLLAARLGMRPETFSRALSKLSKQCSLDINDEQVSIPCINKLIHYICQHCSKTFPCQKYN